jgi:hypothetical protein
VADRLVWLLHVPLDKYSILAIRNCLRDHPAARDIGTIPSNATMGFVKSERMYQGFQAIIHDLAKKADTPPIALDILSWDIQHLAPPE